MILRRLWEEMKRPGEVAYSKVELRKRVFMTYWWLRWGMLVIAAAFPFLLQYWGEWRYGLPLQDSMSAYYWAVPGLEHQDSMSAYYQAVAQIGVEAPMRDWFVGLLFALGTCLFLYKGYSRLEDWLLDVAAGFAICVALFPMCWAGCPSWSLLSLLSWPLHYAFALGFFFILAVVAGFHGVYSWGVWRRKQQQGLESWQRVFAVLYIISAVAMPFAPLLTWVILDAYWGEVAGIGAFCFFWAVQIAQIRTSKIDQVLVNDQEREKSS